MQIGAAERAGTGCRHLLGDLRTYRSGPHDARIEQPRAGHRGAGGRRGGRIRLEDVQRVTEAALAYLDLDDLLAELLDRVTDILEADTAAVLLVEDDGTDARRPGRQGPRGGGRAGVPPAGRARLRRARRCDARAGGDPGPRATPGQVVNPLMREKGVRSLLGVPLIVEGEVIGVLHVGMPDAAGVPMRATSSSCSWWPTVSRSRSSDPGSMVQGQIAQTLQRSLLPRSLPQLPGLRMAARYLPAAQESAVGGDWYDVIQLGHRRLGLAIGDVAGHGMAAATYMGQLRSAMRAYALEIEAPGEVLDQARALLGSGALADGDDGLRDAQPGYLGRGLRAGRSPVPAPPPR